MIAEHEFGVKRIWSQLAFKVFGRVDAAEDVACSRITAKLAAWNYISTIWNPHDVISSGELCDWDVRAWPLKQCLKLIGTCPLSLPKKRNWRWSCFGFSDGQLVAPSNNRLSFRRPARSG